MALKRLLTEEMLGLSSTWVEPNHPARMALASVPQIAAMLPQIDLAHERLLAVVNRALTPERLAEIRSEQDVLDGRHDDLIRGSFFRLKAEEYLAESVEVAADMRELSHVLLPDGLSAVNKTYRAQVGQARAVASRLTPERASALSALATPQGTLLDTVNAWLDLARELGELDRERNGTLADGRVPEGRDGSNARNLWIRTVTVMRSILDLVHHDNDTVSAILAHLRSAEAEAERRARARARDDAEADADTDADADADADDATTDEVADLAAEANASPEPASDPAAEANASPDAASDPARGIAPLAGPASSDAPTPSVAPAT